MGEPRGVEPCGAQAQRGDLGAKPPAKIPAPSGDVFQFELDGRSVAQRRVHSAAIVERLDVLEDTCSRLISGPVVLVVDELGLQRVEEALLRCVVVAVALATHAGLDAVGIEQVAEVLRRVLNAAVGVVDQARLRGTPIDRCLNLG